MTKDDDPVRSNAPRKIGEMSEAEIDRNLQDTFPASDPPSWTLGTNHKEQPVTNESDEDEPPRH
jgi:hypothetical protein